MKAIIKNAQKEVLPRFNNVTGQDEDTLMVVIGVDFVNDDGTLHHTQSYAKLPEELGADPKAYFQDQANSMQADIDGAIANAGIAEQSALADDIISKLIS